MAKNIEGEAVVAPFARCHVLLGNYLLLPGRQEGWQEEKWIFKKKKSEQLDSGKWWWHFPPSRKPQGIGGGGAERERRISTVKLG